MVSNEHKVAAFAAFKPFFHILSIYDWKNLQNSNRRIAFKHRCQAIAVFVAEICYFIVLVSGACLCMETDFNVTECATQIGLLINSTQLAITYMSIRLRKDHVNEVIININEVVLKRE